MIRAVFDTGIFVQAALTNGQGRWLVSQAFGGKVQLVRSAKMSYELEMVLQHPRTRALTRWTPQEEQAYLQSIERAAVMRTDPRWRWPLAGDPDDNFVVALAMASHVPLVTWERRIHRAHPSTVEVVKPDAFCARLMHATELSVLAG